MNRNRMELAPAALSAAGEALYVTRLDGIILYWSPAAERLFGYPPEAALGQSASFLLCPPRSALAAREAFAEAAATGYAFAELARRRQDGRLLDTRVSLRRVPGPDGEGEVLAVAERDLGPFQRMEGLLMGELQRAQDERALLSTVLDSVTEFAILATDLEGRLQVWSRGAERLFGLAAATLQGWDWHQLLPQLAPDHDPLLHGAFRRALQGAVVEGEFEARAADGRRFPARAVLRQRQNRHGETVGVVGFLQDLTAQRRAIEAEVQRDAARASERMQAEFLAHMSHEIRTPMNSVVAITRLLEGTELSASQREMLSILRLGSDHLLALINNILDLSRLRAGKVELERQPLDLRLCVEEALELVAPRAAEKDLRLSCHLDEQLPKAILGDAARLRQVLLNLLSNAVKFTPRGSVHVEVCGAPEDGQWRIEIAVHDSGIGIPPDRLDRLFTDFSQADAATAREYGGSGLGLAISRRLCALMGGSITVESVPGQGSSFSFTLLAPAQDEHTGGNAERQAFASLNVLLVDDSPNELQLISRRLQALGVRVTATLSAREALDWIEGGQHFDLAILDQRMPEMSGAALAAQIRARAGHRALPQILISAYPVQAEELQALDPSIEAVLPKPLRPSLLQQYLREALRQRAEGAAPLPAGSAPLRILLADDSVMNRRVGLMTLERLGYAADVAANGVEVLRALESRRYDLILMDVQMPDLDGLEATRAIRARGESIPQPLIVAMTAQALAGDRERCLAAGMDDYLSKPIDPQDLAALLRRLSQRVSRLAAAGSAPAAPAEPEIDPSALAQLAASLGPTAVPSVIDLFFEESPRRIAALVDGARNGDLAEVTRQAHTLKSNGATIGARRFSRLCAELEAQGRERRSDGLLVQALQLQSLHARICDELQVLREQYEPATG